MLNYYEILNISRKASQEEIKKAYHIFSRKYHPDNAGEGVRDRFERIQEAYGVLSDEKKKEDYDRSLAAGNEGRRAGKYRKIKNYFENPAYPPDPLKANKFFDSFLEERDPNGGENYRAFFETGK